MAFSRSVLSKVPGFDTELGAGALGFGEEILFGWQLARAGFHISGAFQARVYHYFDISRTSKANMVSAARQLARSNAYIDYHWRHLDIRSAIPKLAVSYVAYRLTLAHCRLRGQPGRAAAVEKEYAYRSAYYDFFHKLSGQPRKYDHYGLNKVY
jgi:hypothetical protein